MSNLLSRLGQFASMESDATPDTLEMEVDEGGAPLDVDNLAETAMVDAAEDETVVEEADQESTDLVETTEALEMFLDTAIAHAHSKGGWNRNEAYLAQVAVESIFARIGIHGIGNEMVSYESYGNSNNKDRVISLEGAIMDALRQLWGKIKEVLNKMVTFVRKWYLKLLDGASRLKKRAQGIKKTAEGKSGTAKDKKLTDSPLLRQVHMGKAVPKLAEITDSLDTIKAVTDEILGARTGSDYAQGLSDFADKIESITKDDGKNTGVTLDSQLTGHVTKASLTVAKVTGGSGFPDEGTRYANYSSLLYTKQLIGGKVIVAGKREIALTAADSGGTKNDEGLVEIIDVRIDDWAAKKLDVDKGNLEMLGLSQITSYCDKVIDILDIIIKYKAGWDKYETATKTFIKKMDKVTDGKGAGDDEDKVIAKMARFGARVGNALVKSHANASKAVISLGMQTSRATLAYCSACVGKYSK